MPAGQTGKLLAIRNEDIGQWLSANSDLSKVSERDLRELADTYPYSEMLQWLYLKKLYVEDDVRFEARLEQVAMQVSSRRQLYYYLTADAASVAVEAVTGWAVREKTTCLLIFRHINMREIKQIILKSHRLL